MPWSDEARESAAEARRRKHRLHPIVRKIVSLEELIDSELLQSPDLEPDRGNLSGPDETLRHINEMTGTNGEANVVSRFDMDHFVGEGEHELFRGLTDVSHAQAYRSGPLHPGRGLLGSGTYTMSTSGGDEDNQLIGSILSNALGQTGSPAHNLATRYAGGNNDGVLRMTLKPDAVVLTHEEVMDRIDTDFEAAQAQLATADTGRAAQIRRYMQIILNPGRWAALNGVDAIISQEYGYVLVTNRTATRVQVSPPTPPSA